MQPRKRSRHRHGHGLLVGALLVVLLIPVVILGQLTADEMAELRTAPGPDWVGEPLILEDAPFAEVARALEDRYRIEVMLADSSAPVPRLDAVFHDEPLVEVINTVAVALGLDYVRQRRTIVFAQKPLP